MTGATVVLVVRADYLATAPRTPIWRPSSPRACTSSARWRPPRCARPSRSPPGAGLRLEPGLVELILRDAPAQPGRPPPVARARRDLAPREGATLTVAGYEASGGISGAIAQSADRLYQSMDPDQRVTCRWLLLRLVASGPTAALSAAGCSKPSERMPRGNRFRCWRERDSSPRRPTRSRWRTSRSRPHGRASGPGSMRTPRARASSRRWPRPQKRGTPRVGPTTTSCAAHACSRPSNGATRRPGT